MQAETEVVTIAVTNKGSSLEFAAASMKKDYDIALAAVK